MATTRVAAPAFPDERTLRVRIEGVAEQRSILLIERTPFASGTFPKEIIRCRTSDGGEIALFCKYAAPRHHAFGHRGGIDYEAHVYRDILGPLDMSAPRLLAAGDSGTSSHWLMFELLRGQRLSEEWSEMPSAARWSARFHALNAARLPDPALEWLTAYDEPYYMGWSDRTIAFASGRSDVGTWLHDLREYFRENIAVLLEADPTIIHGEYTIHNVMVAGGVVFPTDWESAAVGPGEVDLMSLVDRWTPDVMSECVRAYARERWPDGVPTAFEQRLKVAELYLHFRWLGEDPELMAGPKRAWRFSRLLELAREVGAA